MTALAENVVKIYEVVKKGIERMNADIQNLTNSMRPGRYDNKSSLEAADLEKLYITHIYPLWHGVFTVLTILQI